MADGPYSGSRVPATSARLEDAVLDKGMNGMIGSFTPSKGDTHVCLNQFIVSLLFENVSGQLYNCLQKRRERFLKERSADVT